MQAYGVDALPPTDEELARDIAQRMQDVVRAAARGHDYVAKSQLKWALYHAWQLVSGENPKIAWGDLEKLVL